MSFDFLLMHTPRCIFSGILQDLLEDLTKAQNFLVIVFGERSLSKLAFIFDLISIFSDLRNAVYLE